ncbi:MAG: methylenetetrahydrofolate reductase [Pseudomonadota bacterium]
MPATALKLAETPPGTAQRITGFLHGFSMEATRLNAADIEALKSALPQGTQLYLTAIPNKPQAEQIEAAVCARAAGFEPVPHLAARSIESRGALDEALARMTKEAGVRRALVIAGDTDRPKGPFASAIELIESGLLQRHGIGEVGIAGYPEGHPRISQDVLDRVLVAKAEAAEQTGLSVHVVTQFAFDAQTILSWLARLRDLGIEHPVRIGMAGPTSLATLLRYAHRCGVRASAQGLTRQAGLIKHLLGTSAPDGVIRPLAEACAGGRLGRVAAHFFSFGGAAATARWARAAAAGRIVLDRTDGFSVTPP